MSAEYRALHQVILEGKTALVVGLGEVGKRVGRALLAMVRLWFTGPLFWYMHQSVIWCDMRKILQIVLEPCTGHACGGGPQERARGGGAPNSRNQKLGFDDRKSHSSQPFQAAQVHRFSRSAVDLRRHRACVWWRCARACKG
jgi:hypothetical protein